MQTESNRGVSGAAVVADELLGLGVLRVSVTWYVKFNVMVSCRLFCMGEGRGAYRILVGRSEGRRLLGRSRCRWEDNIKMDLQAVGWGGID
jgi:hypothetical protein